MIHIAFILGFVFVLWPRKIILSSSQYLPGGSLISLFFFVVQCAPQIYENIVSCLPLMFRHFSHSYSIEFHTPPLSFLLFFSFSPIPVFHKNYGIILKIFFYYPSHDDHSNYLHGWLFS